jgi:hypothetical protein
MHVIFYKVQDKTSISNQGINLFDYTRKIHGLHERRYASPAHSLFRICQKLQFMLRVDCLQITNTKPPKSSSTHTLKVRIKKPFQTINFFIFTQSYAFQHRNDICSHTHAQGHTRTHRGTHARTGSHMHAQWHARAHARTSLVFNEDY